jgi:SagB-type dehydrogenase family enzyme
MRHEKWQDILIPPGNDDACWELFHENSKVSRYDTFQSTEEVREEMLRLHEALPYESYPKIELPTKIRNLDIPLGDAICTRRSVRELDNAVLDLETVATILYYSYGLTGRNDAVPRSFRATPSGGALYPIELYLYSACMRGVRPGIYHYNPCAHRLTLLNPLESPMPICQAVRQPELVSNASMTIFITALFERSVSKYRDRGYRFALIEAGHVAQNLQLVLQGAGLAGVGIGGFYDREIDKLLRLDGLTHSTLYMIALGATARGNVEIRADASAS